MTQNTVLPPSGLMCELLSWPEKTVIPIAKPKFGWSFNSAQNNDYQKAWQILLSSDPRLLKNNSGDMWDSGKVVSSESLNIQYKGKKLSPSSTYYWKVRTWNTHGQPSSYSHIQKFKTASKLLKYAVAAYPLHKEIIEAVSVVSKGPVAYFVDFGKASFGTLKLKLDCPVQGQVITVHLGEALKSKNTIDPNPGGTIRYKELRLPLKRGLHSYKLRIPHDPNHSDLVSIRMPAYIGEVMPFRYCEIKNSPCKIDKKNIVQVSSFYQFDEAVSDFKCSEKVLNQVWELCKYSIKATSFCGLYVDGDRERIPYEADAYINQLTHYCVDREFSLARNTHEYLIKNPNWCMEWHMYSVLLAWLDYMYTGNKDSLNSYYKDLTSKTLLALANEKTGLISTESPAITEKFFRSIYLRRPNYPAFKKEHFKPVIDWPPCETDTFDFKPVNSVMNAFHFITLVLMSKIAKSLGKTKQAYEFQNCADKVKKTFNSVFLDKSSGLYIDGIGSTHRSLHANMFALAFNLVPHQYVCGICKFLQSRGMACSVYGSQWLLEALYKSGIAGQYALSLMKREGPRSWANMIKAGSTITWEAWDLDTKPNQDWNHAWGSAPGNLIPRFLMGVQPLDPGFGKILIKPQPGDLKWASIVIPTVRGPIHVDFKTVRGKRVFKIITPANTETELYLPCFGKKSAELLWNGILHNITVGSNYAFIGNIGNGEHKFEL